MAATVSHDIKYSDPRDQLVQLVCILLGVHSADEAIEKLGKVGVKLSQATAKRSAAAIEEELLQTEISAVQAECMRSTGRGMPVSEALAIVTARRAGKSVNVADHAHKDAPPPLHPDETPAAVQQRIAAMRANSPLLS